MGGSSSRGLMPVLQKSSEVGENDRIKYAASSMQGWRRYMEDAVSNPLVLFQDKWENSALVRY
jgi:hypothetical protein